MLGSYPFARSIHVAMKGKACGARCVIVSISTAESPDRAFLVNIILREAERQMGRSYNETHQHWGSPSSGTAKREQLILKAAPGAGDLHSYNKRFCDKKGVNGRQKRGFFTPLLGAFAQA